MPLVMTRQGLLSIVANVTGGSPAPPFNPTAFNPLFYGRFDTNAYQDTSQATPATAFPQVVQQLRDVREAHGGNLFPYLEYRPTPGGPVIQPALSALGGVLMYEQVMQFHNLGPFNADNVTAFVVGVPVFDYIGSFNGGALLQLGTVFSSGIFLGYYHWGANNQYCLTSDVNSSFVTHTDVPLGLSNDVVMVHSKPAGLMYKTRGAASSLLTPAASASVSNGYIGDDARLTGNYSLSGIAALAVFAPALSDTDAMTVYAGLTGLYGATSVYPLSKTLLAFLGDSITIGVENCPVAAGQTFPYVVVAGRTGSPGAIYAAKSGMRSDQIQAAYQADVLVDMTSAPITGPRWLNVLAGTNDLANGDSAATIVARLQSLCQPFATAGITVNVCTIFDNQGLTTGQQTARATLNGLLLAAFPTATGHTRVTSAAGGTTWAATLTDLASNPNLANAANVTYFNDGTHLTPAGYASLAGDLGGALAQAGIS